jgi:HEPN domain-containing protein
MNGADKLTESVAAWIKRAEEDFRALTILLKADNPPWGSVAFNAQQCAEKYLKALLLWRGIEFPKTHDLARLLTLFGETPPLTWTSQETAALSDHAVAPRYPDEFEPVNEQEAREAVRLATDARERLRELLPIAALK